jgi:hypothetical protein
MKKKRNKMFIGTYADGRRAHRSFILPLPQQGSPLWRQTDKLLLLLLLHPQRRRKAQRVTLDTSALFLIRNPAAAIAPSHSKKEEEKQLPKGSRAAVAAAAGKGKERERERGAAALLRRAARAAKAEQQAEQPDTGWLDSFTQMGVAIYGANDKLLVPGRIQEDPAVVDDDGPGVMLMLEQTVPTSRRMPEEDLVAAAERTATMLMLEQTEPTLRHPTHTRSSRSAGPPEKQPWTFGGSFWPSRK